VYNITLNDYEFLDTEPNAISYRVRMKTGPFTDAVWEYGKVTAQVNEDEETATLKFDYELLEGDPLLEQNKDFNDRIGAILEHIIQSAFDSGDYKIGNKDEHTDTANDDTKEPSK
jgi:hypothetical protein